MSDRDSTYVVTETEVEGRVRKSVAKTTPQLAPLRDDELRYVGRSIHRVDAVDKVTGRARFASDVRRPHQLHGSLVQSRWPNASPANLEQVAREIRDHDGVACVWTPLQTEKWSLRGEPIFSRRARYAGDELAVVVAESEVLARRVARLMERRLVYDRKPHVSDLEAAINSEAPAVVGDGPNYMAGGWESDRRPGGETVYTRGKERRLFGKAAVLVEGRYQTPCQQHFCFETHGSVAEWMSEDSVRVWTSTQGVFFIRAHLADALQMPLSKVEVTSRHMGGGFGSKSAARRADILAVLLARELRRPVRIFMDRSQDTLGPWNRPRSVNDVTFETDKNGRFVAASADTLNQAGASPDSVGVASSDRTFQHQYTIPNLRLRNRAVLTHTPPASALRCPVSLESAWVLEQAIDEAAIELDMDPLEIRLRNIPAVDADSADSFASNGFRACLEQGAEAFNWSQRRSSSPKTRGDRLVGVGVGSIIWGGGGGPPAGAEVLVHDDGSATVLSGAADIGTGTRTVLLQIAADELQLNIDRLSIRNADTADCPYTMPSFGSLTVASSGPAVRQAAADALEQMSDLAAALLNVSREELEYERGEFWAGDASESDVLSWQDVASRLPNRTLIGRGERGPNPDGQVLRTWAAHFAEVEVDPVTGKVGVTEVVAAHDSGRVINPAMWRSQICGGITMAMGFALSEGREMDHNLGVQLNPRLTDYKLMTIADIPDIRAIDVKVPYDANEIGAKGVAEPAIGCTAPAIANAVFDACGVRIREAPITPDKVLRGLSD